MATRKSKKKEGTDVEMTPGAVYLSHIPHGFYEKEMASYFSQFGDVTRLKLIRSKRTGRSRGFAFVEFACSEVAKIVAETHNNYLLFEKLLKCHYVDPATLHPKTFTPFRLKKPKISPKAKTHEEVAKHVKGVLRRESKKRKRLKNLGIDYEFPGYAGCLQDKQHLVKKPKHIVFSEENNEQE